MRQALHIFRKDVRFLRLPIALAFALTAAFAWSRARDHSAAVQQPITTLLILAWWYLAAAPIYKETLVGDRQFWVTRPYRWRSLLAAKALFLVAFIHVPLLAADLTIVAGQGFPVSLRTLLWRQLGLAALVTLPAAAIASVTRSLAALAMTGIAALICVLIVLSQFDNTRNDWAAAYWIRGTAILVALAGGAAATLVWQYARRRTAVGRAVAASGLGLALCVMVASPLGYWIISRKPTESEGFRSIRVSAMKPTDQFVSVRLRIAGVPQGMRAEPQLMAITVDDGGGHEWRSGWTSRFQGGPLYGGLQWNVADDNEIFVAAEPWGASQLSAPPAKVHASIILAVYGPAANQCIPVDGRPHATPIGRCTFEHGYGSQQLDMTCWTAEYAHKNVRIEGTNVPPIEPGSYLKYLSASPILESSLAINMTPPPGDTVTLTTEPRATRIRREIDIPVKERR
jgi:hypothetical protein